MEDKKPTAQERKEIQQMAIEKLASLKPYISGSEYEKILSETIREIAADLGFKMTEVH